MKPDEAGYSANLALWYKDIPIQADDLKAFEGKITKQCWKYLIGKVCLSEKIKRGKTESVDVIYEQIGKDFGYVHSSLKRLVNYTNSVDRIQKILPDIAEDILNGKSRLSLPDTIVLSKMDFPDICNIIERLANEKTQARIIFSEQKTLNKGPERRGRPKRNTAKPAQVSVKDTPIYNPDAQVNGLIYTIPSWLSMIERVSMASDFYAVSPDVRNRLIEELKKLTDLSEVVAAVLSEVE